MTQLVIMIKLYYILVRVDFKLPMSEAFITISFTNLSNQVFLSNVKLTKQGKAFRATAFTQDGLKMFVWTFKSLETNKPKAADHVVETSDGNKVSCYKC